MAQPPYDQIQAAFDAALVRREALVAEPLVHALRPDVVDKDDFAAIVQKEEDGFVIRISTGVAKQLNQLWREALDASVISIDATTDEMTELSLTWLILHEIEHIYLNHFHVVDAAFMTEGDCAPVFGLLKHDGKTVLRNIKLPVKDMDRASQCLELQADHEAMDIVLNAFQREVWPDLHKRALAVAAVILLIERADQERGVTHDTHPPAAARLFQLLGHLCELWIVPAKLAARERGDHKLDPADFPSDDVIHEFRDDVCVPAFTDTLALAQLAGSQDIAADLGDVDAFFWDVAIASTADQEKLKDLRTQGARHLMSLFPLNGPILEALGHEGLG